jgi:multiple sugar transport system permease protein
MEKLMISRNAPSRVPLKTIKHGLLGLFTWAFGLTMLVPLVWMVSTSLKVSGMEFQMPPQFIARPAQWTNYAIAWQSVSLERLFFNSCLVTVGITLGQLITCSLSAYAFSKMTCPGRDKIFMLYLATLMIPGVVTLIPVFAIVKALGWIDTYQALIVPGIFSAYGTFMLRQFFLNVPQALIDSAKIDGCGPFRVYWNVILPLSRSALVALAIISIMGAWRDFLWPLVVTNTEEMRTLTVGLATFRGAYSTDWNMLMAASCMTILPLVIVFIFCQRFFIEGIQLSGIKE